MASTKTTTSTALISGTKIAVVGNTETINDSTAGAGNTATMSDGSVITVTAVGITDVGGNSAQIINDYSNKSDVIAGNNSGDTITDYRTGLSAGTGDTFIGGTGKDMLTDAGLATVGSYSDTMFGGNGSDTIKGGAGHDVLIGGLGGDTMYSGTGTGNADTYVYVTNGASAVSDLPFALGGPVATGDVGGGWDVINGFRHGIDKLDFNTSLTTVGNTGVAGASASLGGKSVDAALTGQGPSTLYWLGQTVSDSDSATTSLARAHEVWQDAGHNFIYADINGDGRADLKIQVSNVSASDINGVSVDTTGPTIHGAANQTDEATSAAGAVATFSATATDNVDIVNPTVAFTEGSTVVHSGGTFALGTHTITETATDLHGNTSTSSFTITVQDTTGPVIAGASNQTDEATSASGAVATFVATATDAVDGTDTVVFKEGSTVVHSGDTFALGTHTITETATDAHGNAATPTSFTIDVVDTTPPVIAGAVDQTDEATSASGAVATFSATATDAVDVTDSVSFSENDVAVHSGDTFGLGAHTITETATDNAGNISTTSFTIDVVDTTPPVIAGAVDQTDEATSASGAVATFSATATDAVDVTDSVSFSENDVAVHSGDTFGLGTHTITETATDNAGNISTTSFTIDVVDTTPPVIAGAVDQTDEATSASGAVATFSATATDAVDVTDSVSFSENDVAVHSGDTFGLGAHTITETATDNAGNISTTSFTIDVVDTTPPVIAGAVDQTDEATSASGAVATFSATATDAVDVTDLVSFSENDVAVHSGDTFGLGTHTIIETATDAHGNAATPTSFTITVQDTIAPDTIIDTSPAATTTSTSAAFTWHGTDSGSGIDHFVYSLDGGTGVSTTGTSVTLNGLSLGDHTFTVDAVDVAGNVDASPATDSWHINSLDLGGPTGITFVPTQTGNQQALGHFLETGDPDGANDTYGYTYAVAGNSPNVIVSSTGDLTVNTSSTATSYAMTVTAHDQVGNTVSEAFNVVLGSNGNTADPLSGTTGSDIIAGFNGNDTLTGGNGVDFLLGGQQDDVLIGGAGADVLLGGGGNDVFKYAATTDSVHGAADTILDFGNGSDFIDLTQISGLSGAAFVNATTAPATIAAHTIEAFASGGNTTLYVNNTANAEAANSANMEIQLTGVTALASGDVHHA